MSAKQAVNDKLQGSVADCKEPGSAPEPYTLGNRVWATVLHCRPSIDAGRCRSCYRTRRMPARPLSNSSTTLTATDKTLPSSQHPGLPSTRSVTKPSVREFSDFKKRDFLRFFEMACQKVVKSSYSKSFVLSPSKWVHILRPVITVIT